MAMELDIFRQKVPSQIFRLTHQISLLAEYTHFKQPFHYKTQKQLILRHLSLFPMYIKFQVNLAEVSLM